MDLTIAPGASAAVPLPQTRTNRQEQLKPGPRKNSFSMAGKAGRHEKFRKIRITSYSLSGDSAFKRAGVPFGGEPRFGPATGIKGFGAALGEGMSGISPSASNVLSTANPVHAQDAADNAGIAFGCGKKSRLSSLEVSACYVHKVDKAWKTQTYVTKSLADSNPGWGGGLSVGYAY